jgi:sec-independent protein translocase protein TatA
MGLDNPLHIAFLLLVVLLVFGAKRLPELGRSLGGGMRGFRDALGGADTSSALPARALAAEPLAAVAHDAVPAAPAALPATPPATPQL